MGHFGKDEIGIFRQLDDGRVLRIEERAFNTLLTISSSQEDQGWQDGW